MLPALAEQYLSRLRRVLAEHERHVLVAEGARLIRLGLAEADAALGGGLSCAALHELSAAAPTQFGAAAGFALALAARAEDRAKQTLFIATDFACLEAGTLYGPGLDLFGLPMERLLIARVPRPVDALFAMEEALKCRALSAVIAEFPEGTADLTASRRLTLAAREGGALGLLLRHTPTPMPSAARTRWHVASTPSMPDEFGGLGATAFSLSLVRNRRGPSGRWTVAWNHHDRVFSALSLGVAEAACDRPDHEALGHSG